MGKIIDIDYVNEITWLKALAFVWWHKDINFMRLNNLANPIKI